MSRKRVPAFPFQIKLYRALRVDEKLARMIRERANAHDRRIGWEVILLLRAGLAAKSIPEHIGWSNDKRNVSLELLTKYIDERTVRKIRARAIANSRTMTGEIIHLLKAAILAECLEKASHEKVTPIAKDRETA